MSNCVVPDSKLIASGMLGLFQSSQRVLQHAEGKEREIVAYFLGDAQLQLYKVLAPSDSNFAQKIHVLPWSSGSIEHADLLAGLSKCSESVRKSLWRTLVNLDHQWGWTVEELPQSLGMQALS